MFQHRSNILNSDFQSLGEKAELCHRSQGKGIIKLNVVTRELTRNKLNNKYTYMSKEGRFKTPGCTSEIELYRYLKTYKQNADRYMTRNSLQTVTWQVALFTMGERKALSPLGVSSPAE